MTSGDIVLGDWEKHWLLQHLDDDACCVNWLVELERPVDPALVEAALAAVRRVFPFPFAGLRVAPGTASVLAVPRPRRPIGEYLTYWPQAEGGFESFARTLVNDRLDPLEDGLFRCHLVAGPVPMLAFKATHLIGDAYTNHWLRAAFAWASGQLHAGRPAELTSPPTAYSLGVADVMSRLRVAPREIEDSVRRARRLRVPAMTAPAPGGELRVLRAVITPARFATVVRRAIALGVTPVALLGAAVAGAVRSSYDPWGQAPGDYFAVSVPRDLRSVLGRDRELGNLCYPQGIPILADDPVDTESMAKVISARLRAGAMNRIMYRYFCNQLRETRTRPVRRETAPAGDRRLVRPLPVLGATEIPARPDIDAIAGVRVLRTAYQTPIFTRRQSGGQVHLGCTLRWHPDLDDRLRAFAARLFTELLGPPPVDWELL